VVTDIIAFALRTPLLALIAFAGIEDPLYALVAFHSLFNMLGLIIFVPLTGSFARRLEQLFPVRERFEASYLGEVSSGVSEAAVDAIERETSLLIARAVRLNMAPFDPPLQAPAGNPPVPHQRGIEAQSARPFDELYRAAKTLEGELVEFTIRLQAAPLDTADSERLGQLLSAAREAMHSAKAIKDIHHNLIEFQNSGSEAADLYLHRFREWMSNFIGDIYGLREENTNRVSFEDLVSVLQNTYKRHDAIHEDIYTDVRNDEIAQTLVSSLLNVNRELLTSNRALLLALGDYYLDTTAAEDLERIPV
jgi:phosphate:Na+ symporter